jgi:hypothetical protein
MNADVKPIDWETELAELLTELTSVQDDLLTLLQKKREQMMAPDLGALERTEDDQRQLCARLEACQQHRQRLLRLAESRGLPAASIRQLTGSLKDLDRDRRGQLNAQIQHASARMRLLQHHSLTNWVLAQRSLLHLTQILEIIATGGRLKPTYGEQSSELAAGSLVDRAA